MGTSDLQTYTKNGIESYFDLDAQLKEARVVKVKGKKDAFNIYSSNGQATGSYLCLPIFKAPLATVGKKDAGLKGFNVFLSGPYGDNTLLSMRLDPVNHGGLRTFMQKVLSFVGQKLDFQKKSRMFETMFKELDDGTKVYNASQYMTSPERFAGISDFSEDNWNLPTKNWTNFVYGPESEDSAWYMTARIDQRNPDDILLLFDSKGKRIGNRKEEDISVYPKSGIPLQNNKQISLLVNSSFFKNSKWTCSGVLLLTGFTMEMSMNVDKEPYLYPKFHFKMRGSLRVDENTVTYDNSPVNDKQVLSIYDYFIFEGVQGPSKKRKRVNPKDDTSSITKVTDKTVFEREVISDTDLDGNDSETSE